MSAIWWLIPGARAETLSLDQAVERARTDSHEAKAALAKADEAEARRGVALATVLPQVNVAGQYQHWDQEIVFPSPLDPTGQTVLTLQKQDAIGFTATASQVVFAPATFGKLHIAEANADGAAAQAGVAVADLGLRAVQLWVTARANDELLAVATGALESAERHQKAAEAMLAAGSATALTADRARLQTGDAQRRVLEMQKARADAYGQLGLLVRMDPATLVLEAPSTEGATSVVAPSVDAAIAQALQRRPELSVARAQVDATHASTWFGLGDWGPTISANGMWRATNNPGFLGEPTSWYVGATATMPILDGGVRFADIKLSHSMAEQATEALARLEESTAEDLRSAMRGIDTARQSLDLSKAQEEVAQRAETQSETSWQAGVATESDLEDARQAALDAAAARIRAEGGLVIAQYTVKRLMGDDLMGDE